MPACPKCGTEVREGKAFCHNCGASMTRKAPAREEPPAPEFRETVLERPRRAAPEPTVQPAAQPSSAPDSSVARAPAQPTPAPVAATAEGRKSFYGNFGIGVVILLLLVILAVIVLAVLSD